MMSKDIHKWATGRYTLMFDEHTFFVWDNEKGKRMTALQVTEKLNEQQSTIKKQDERIRSLISEIRRMRKIAEKNGLKIFDSCYDAIKVIDDE